MGIKINQYALERLTFGDDDYYDIDYFDGANYQTAKILGSTIKAGIQAGITSDNIYSIDGTLTANRTLDGGLFDLTLDSLGKIKIVSDQSGVDNITFIVNDNATNKAFNIEDSVTSESLFMIKNGEVRINDDYSLPITDGTANQVLTTDGSGQVSWADVVGTSGLVDLTGKSGSSNKVNLTSVTTQNRIGYGIKFTAGTNLVCGQPVIYDYASGVVTAITSGALPSQHEYIGICLETVSSGASVEIVTQGLVTGRRDTINLPSTENVSLDNITNGTIRNLTNQTVFTDSGGSSSNYTSNENYLITFDSGVVYTTDIKLIDLGFEQSSFNQYDRLGIQVSNDGINFSNVSIQYLQTMATSTPPWSDSFAGGVWSSGASANGYVLPALTSRAITLGGVPSGTFPATISTGFRYVRFYFRSDSSSNDLGWEIDLFPNTPYPTGAAPVAEGTTLYLDNSDYTKITTDNTSQIVVGYCAYDDASNDSIFMRVK